MSCPPLKTLPAFSVVRLSLEVRKVVWEGEWRLREIQMMDTGKV